MRISTSADDGATHPKVLTIAVAVNPRAAFGGRRNNTTGHIGEVMVERLRYNLAILRELITLKALDYSLVVDGVPCELAATLISVANGTSIGGGMLITPEARYDDGQLDLFVVSPVPRRTFVRIFPLVYSGRHTEHPVVLIERVTEVSLASPGLVGYADGERIGVLPLTIRVDPAALRVWV